MKRYLTIAICTAFISQFLSATIIHIPEDYPEIQAGLDAAADFDTIYVSNGVYYENIIYPWKYGIKLIGENRDSTIIDGNSQGKVFGMAHVNFEPFEYFDPSWDTTTVIKNFTLQHGFDTGSSGLLIYGGSPKIENLHIRNNYTDNDVSQVTQATTVLVDMNGIFNNIEISENILYGQISNGGINGGGLSLIGELGGTYKNLYIHDNEINSDHLNRGAGIFIHFDWSSVVDTLTLDSIVLENNIARTSDGSNFGGGIYVDQFVNDDKKTLVLTNSLIQNNICRGVSGENSGSFGAGILTRRVDLILQNTIVQENAGVFSNIFGIGIGVNEAYIKLIDSQIRYNIAVSDSLGEDNSAVGGGINILCHQNDSCEVFGVNSSIHHNQASGGGGLYLSGQSQFLIRGLEFRNNFAISSGGAINANSYETINITHSVFKNNVSGDTGGAIESSASVNLLNSVLINNMAINHGGSVYISMIGDYGYTAVHYDNVISQLNSPEEICMSFTHDYSVVDIFHSLIDKNYDDIYNEIPLYGLDSGDTLTLNWVNNLVDVDPMFVDPQSNDFHLQENSPCIDAGDPYLPLDPDLTISDIGAFYFHQDWDPVPGDMNIDGGVNILDVVLMVTIILWEEPNSWDLWAGDFNESGSINIQDHWCPNVS